MQNNDPTSSSEDDAARSGARLEENVKSRSTWLRLLFMIVCGFLYAVSRLVVFFVVVLQFFWLLFTGDPNARLTAAGQSLATYTYQLLRYLTFNSNTRPFPFDDDWPTSTPL
ncbi:MAG: DUF4389 domain-containing protein [Woeseia sp.]